ncbi:heat shock protein 67B1-like [Lucilia sericata]|uniref:heat shock protein 67B1-like n=1 Tax=Lucilia sericata TaxID=13632 RepID=UPI0018A86B07|nr:heat shock protein 67B1-like [Lucilia sericata]
MSLIPFILDLADELHEFSRCLANGIDINDFGFGLYTGTDQQHQPQQHQQQQQQQQQQQHQPQTSPRRSRTSSFSSFWMPSKRHHPYNRIKTACCAKSGEEAVAGTPENSGKEASGSSSVVGAGGGTPGKSASYSVVNKNGFQVSMNVKQFAPNELSVKTIDNCIVVEGRHDDKEDGHGVISRHFVRKYMLPKGYDPNDVLSTLSSDGILTVKAPPPPPPAAKNDEPNERIIEIQPTPGPTPVLVVSAKDITVKETSKKLPTTAIPSARLECQLPEKRQKLDLPPETEPEEAVVSSAPIPATNTINETDAASVAVAGTEEVVNDDVEMEKADEQINEIVLKQTEQQQQSDVKETDKNDVEKKVENIEQTEKQIAAKEQEEQAENVDETEKKLLDECMSDSNGDAKNDCEKMEVSTSITDATQAATEKTNESAAATKLEESSIEKSNVAKMEVDGEVNKAVGQRNDNVAKKTDNTEIFVAILKTCSVKTAVKPAAAAVIAADSAKQKKDTETTNNTDTSSSISTTTINTTNNNNNTSTNSNTTTTNNSTSTDVATEKTAKDVKDGNGVVTGEISDDIPKSANADSDAATAAATAKVSTDNSSKAESVADGDVEMETAVLSTDTTTTTTATTNIIDDVALLKAATADPADITDNNAEENDILTETMDGITTTADSNTTATTVDNVECSLFAKKSHLGNGNNTTATPLVGTEEMAN